MCDDSDRNTIKAKVEWLFHPFFAAAQLPAFHRFSTDFPPEKHKLFAFAGVSFASRCQLRLQARGQIENC